MICTCICTHVYIHKMSSFYPVHVLGFSIVTIWSRPAVRIWSGNFCLLFDWCQFLIFNYHSGFCFDQLVVVFVKIVFLEIVSQTCFLNLPVSVRKPKLCFCGSAKRDLGVYFVRRLNQQTKLIIWKRGVGFLTPKRPFRDRYFFSKSLVFRLCWNPIL